MLEFGSINTSSQGADKAKAEGESETVRVLILGSGPAGYTAAIYAARANLNPVLYQGLEAGGQLTTTTEVDNFPGYPEGVTGPVMMTDLQKQAERFGTDVRWGMATSVEFSKTGGNHKVWIDNEKLIEAETVIIATGATAKYLGMESEEKYKGFGVSACATCDGFFYKGQDVAVVGGGDTAAEEATYLAGICNKVYLIIRKPIMRASKAMQDRVARTKNIEVLYEHVTKEIVGGQSVEGVILTNAQGEEVRKEITGPGTSKTNVEGVFACGDVQDKHYRQAVTAAGSGCMAALDAERHLGERY